MLFRQINLFKKYIFCEKFRTDNKRDWLKFIYSISGTSSSQTTVWQNIPWILWYKRNRFTYIYNITPDSFNFFLLCVCENLFFMQQSFQRIRKEVDLLYLGYHLFFYVSSESSLAQSHQYKQKKNYARP